jgi:type VI secretion system protein ImpG
LTLPTPPGSPISQRGDREDFSRLSHIFVNFSAMFCQEGERPLELLRNVLRAYPLRPAREMEHMISGIVAFYGKSDVFRFIRNGTMFYERGWRLNMVLDENEYAGMGFYLFALVMAEMILSFSPVNTIVELEFSTRQSGVMAIWKTPGDL